MSDSYEMKIGDLNDRLKDMGDDLTASEAELNKLQAKTELDIDFLEDIVGNDSCIIIMSVDSILSNCADVDMIQKLKIIKERAMRSITAVRSRRE